MHFLKVFLICCSLCLTLLLITPNADCQIVINNVKVERIIDGKTLDLDNGSTVHLIGIDVTTVDSGKIVTVLRGLILNRRVSLEFDTLLQDETGRLQAYVYLDSLSINGMLLRYGYAKVAYETLNVKYRDELVILEEYARKEGLGTWAKDHNTASK